LRVPAVGVDLGLGGSARFIRIIHVDTITFRSQFMGEVGRIRVGFWCKRMKTLGKRFLRSL
jgi:hypothetical protein